MIQLPPDFKEFLRLLEAHEVEYLLIGGYAVAYHGFPRATIDMDIWFAANSENSLKLIATMKEFGIWEETITPEYLCSPNQMLRMGIPPVRLEIMNTVSGLNFEDAYPNAIKGDIDAQPVTIIALDDLLRNKAASGRSKDMTDLENLQ